MPACCTHPACSAGKPTTMTRNNAPFAFAPVLRAAAARAAFNVFIFRPPSAPLLPPAHTPHCSARTPRWALVPAGGRSRLPTFSFLPAPAARLPAPGCFSWAWADPPTLPPSIPTFGSFLVYPVNSVHTCLPPTYHTHAPPTWFGFSSACVSALAHYAGALEQRTPLLSAPLPLVSWRRAL